MIDVPMPGRKLYAVIWKVQVGRVPLYLLDTNIPENALEEDRNLTDRLYGGDRRTRIRQEILMGIGGIRALDKLDLRPKVCHMNEGHSAFLALERARQFMNENDVTFWQAKEITAAGNVFTTHTPVPAGLERFGFDLIDEHFTDYYRELGLNRNQFIDLGREHMGDYELFSMPVLALNMSAKANGVAKLHGVVSRKLWQWMYPGVPEHEIPIGVDHQRRPRRDVDQQRDWASCSTAISTRAGAPKNGMRPVWRDVDMIPDTELWRTHERRRERLVAFTRGRLRMQLQRRGAPQHEIEDADEVLDPDALTIGFARRFATYKRATLIMRDIERLKAILNDAERPVQIIFAGQSPSARHRRQGIDPPDHQLGAHAGIPAPRSSSSKTTTCRSRAIWCRASTCG